MTPTLLLAATWWLATPDVALPPSPEGEAAPPDALVTVTDVETAPEPVFSPPSEPDAVTSAAPAQEVVATPAAKPLPGVPALRRAYSHLWPARPALCDHSDNSARDRGFRQTLRFRPTLAYVPDGFASAPRELRTAEGNLLLLVDEEFGFGFNNVDAASLLAAYPETLPEELVGGQQGLTQRLRLEAEGELWRDRITFWAELYDDWSALRYPVGSPQAELEARPRYSANLRYRPDQKTEITLGGRYEAIIVRNCGISAWTLPSAARDCNVDQISLVATARRQLFDNQELALLADFSALRDDTVSKLGLLVPGHTNLTNYRKWGNYPWTSRERDESLFIDVSYRLFVDGPLIPQSAHHVVAGAQLALGQNAKDDTRNGGFTFVDVLPAADAPLFRETDRQSWSLYSSDRGDELHAKTEQLAVAFYLEDRLEISSRFYALLGLRAEHFLAGFKNGPTVWQTMTWSPRAAARWNITEDGAVALFAEYGRHYRQVVPQMLHRARQGAAYTPLEYWDWTGDPAQVTLPGIDDTRWQRAQQFAPFIGDMSKNLDHPFVDRVYVGLKLGTDRYWLDGQFRINGRVNYEYRRYGSPLALFDQGFEQGQYALREVSFGPAAYDRASYYEPQSGYTPRYTVGNPPGAWEELHRVALGARINATRFVDIDLAWSWQSDRGNLDATSALSTEWRDPSGRLFSEGEMPGTPLQFIGTLRVYLPLRLTVSGSYTYLAGGHFSRLVRVSPVGAPRTYVYDPRGRGGYALPARHHLDASAEMPVPWIETGALRVRIDARNLTNSGVVTGLRGISSYFRAVSAVEPPLQLFLGVKYVY